MGVNVIIILAIVSGGAVFWRIAVSRFRDDTERVAVGLGLLGAMTVLIAFLGFVWIRPSAHETFKKNLGWVQEHQKAINSMLERIPEINTSLRIEEISIYQLLDDKTSHDFLEHVESGRAMHAWQLIKFCWPMAPDLSIALILGILSGLVGIFIAIYEMFAGRTISRIFPIINAIIAVISFGVILEKMAFLDTLGTSENVRIQLIAALAEMEISSAPWWMLIGLSLIVLSGVMHYFTYSAVADDDLDFHEERLSYE